MGHDINMVKTTHFFGFYRSLGGVQAVLKQHYVKDLPWDMDSRFIIYSEPQDPALERVHFLGLTQRSTIAEARQKLSAVIGPRPPQVAVYHGVDGIRSYLVDLDQSLRRLAYLHGKGTAPEVSLLSRRDWIDGVVCVSEEAQAVARHCLPHLGQERIVVLPLPISPSPCERKRSSSIDKPLVLGYCGRLIKEHKRVDRLPELCRQLDQAGLDYRFEILGDGPARRWLGSRLAGNSRVQFHGRQEGVEYWRILNGWDVILFVSDTEGQPLSLLEALNCGVIPVYPRVGSGGDAYVAKIDPSLLFARGQVAEAAQIIMRLSRAPSDVRAQLRVRSQETVAVHLNDTYFKLFADFTRFILHRPRLSRDVYPKRRTFIDNCPFAILNRLGAWRLAWRRRLWHRAPSANAG